MAKQNARDGVHKRHVRASQLFVMRAVSLTKFLNKNKIRTAVVFSGSPLQVRFYGEVPKGVL